MMKKIFLCVVLCVLVNCGMCWVRLIKHSEGSEGKHPGHCYTDVYGIGAMEINASVRVKSECAIAECRPDRDIHISGCGMVRVQPPCELLPGDLSKPYPDCCFEMKCPDNNAL